jgi:hypothetical protein
LLLSVFIDRQFKIVRQLGIFNGGLDLLITQVVTEAQKKVVVVVQVEKELDLGVDNSSSVYTVRRDTEI